MDAVDATTHQEIYATEEVPSLCALVIDTNPRAWAALHDALPISTALANILVFLNAQLAYSSINQVAVIASHTNRAVWLYPPPPEAPSAPAPTENGDDVEMTDAAAASQPSRPPPPQSVKGRQASANKYAPFAHVESTILAALHRLMASTTESDLSTTTSQVSGALTLALHHINKTSLAVSTLGDSTTNPSSNPTSGPGASASAAALHARILVLSVSDSAPAQYIPTMNAVFAAAHASIPIDILALHGAATFLQQASYITRGTFLAATRPRGLLTYLMFGFASSIDTRQSVTTTTSDEKKDKNDDARATGLEQLISPTTATVDFRAACFCHRRVIDTGFVCSVCLSIFCEVPTDAACLTCGNKLALGRYGAKPAVVPRTKKKRKKRVGANGEVLQGSEVPGSASATGTPRPG